MKQQQYESKMWQLIKELAETHILSISVLKKVREIVKLYKTYNNEYTNSKN